MMWDLLALRRRHFRRSSRTSSGPNDLNIEYSGSLNFLVLGNRSVGKTTICMRYVLDNIYGINNHPDTDEFYDSSIFLSKKCTEEVITQYDLHITVAECRRQSVNHYKQQILENDAFVLVYSKDDRQSYMKLVEYLSDIYKVKGKNPSVVVLGNKTDLEAPYIHHRQEHVVLGDYAHFEVSAVNGEGLQEAFKYLVQSVIADFSSPFCKSPCLDRRCSSPVAIVSTHF